MKCIPGLAFCILGMLLLPQSALGQGTIFFRNRLLFSGIDSPVIHGQTRELRTGPDIVAQLLVGADVNALSSVGIPTPLLDGAGAGYFNGGVISVPGLPGGSRVWAQVRVWDVTTGSTFDESVIKASTVVFAIALGGGGIPPNPPNELSGLAGAGPIYLPIIPEPATTTVTLVFMVAACIFLRRRFLGGIAR